VLAGQHSNYLISQLQTFKAQTRGDPDAIGYMWGMAAPLTDEIIVALADYYSKQPARPGTGRDAALITRGKALYENGNLGVGIPACASCHGSDAVGNDSFPRLAGQHAQYLLKQLKSFQTNLRDVAVMHGVAQGMQIAEMQAVATYLESLGAVQ
jgi:cytochrome c553